MEQEKILHIKVGFLIKLFSKAIAYSKPERQQKEPYSNIRLMLPSLILSPFLNTFGKSYQVLADHSGHKLSFKDITIEQSEKMSNRYTFVAMVGYRKNGEEEKTANISGEVIFSTKEEGKIVRFQYRDDDGLLEIMSRSN